MGKNNELILSVDELEGKISSADTKYQRMVADQAQTLSDEAVAEAALDMSAQDCMIGAFIAHSYPQTEKAFDKLFDKLFESVLALRKTIHDKYHGLKDPYEFFFKSPRTRQAYSGPHH